MKAITKLTPHERNNIRVGKVREEMFFGIARIEPRLLTLLEICRTAKREHDRCWRHFDEYWFWFTYMDSLMRSWVGRNLPEDASAIMRTSEAYDAAYMVLLAALPDCRCRHCNDEDWEDWETDWHCGHGQDEQEERYEEEDPEYVRRYPKCTHRSVFERGRGFPIPRVAEEFYANWNKGRVYFIESGELIKIGWSSNVERRLAGLHGASPLPLKLLGDVAGSRAYERALHEKFRHLHHHLEWFKRDDELLAAITEICGEPVDKSA